MRAELDRPTTPAGDAAADQRLTAGIMSSEHRTRTAMFHHIAARTRFIDTELLSALDAGITQVVLVGAGYDGRALRFRAPGVRFFEIDHPATQTDKRERMVALGTDLRHISFAACDFTTDDIDITLAGVGHDADSPTFFYCEGVVSYLDQSVADHLFERLRACAAVGSRFAVSLAVTVAAATPEEEALLAARLEWFARAGEPRRSSLTADGAVSMFARTGWHAGRVLDPTDFDPEAPAGRSRLVVATPA